MVKIERLLEWAASDKCLSVMENTKFFLNSTLLYFIVKWLNFLLKTCTFYCIKYFINFLLLPILAY